MDWLFDHRSWVYLLLASDFVIVLAIWWRTRKQPLLVIAGCTVGLTLLFAVVDLFMRPETDREKLQRTVRELAASLQKPVDKSKVAECVSDRIESKKGLNKAGFESELVRLADEFDVRGVKFSDFRSINIDRAAKTASMRFNVTVDSSKIDETSTVACEAGFVLEDDGQWRLQRYKIFFPATSTDEFSSSELP
jgi:hypothetical protein